MCDHQDAADLERAAHLVNLVLDRHGLSLTGPALTAGCAAIQEIRLCTRYLSQSEALTQTPAPRSAQPGGHE